MPVWAIVIIAVAVVVTFTVFIRSSGSIFSVFPDSLRRSDPRTAETIDELSANPTAVPMHDQAFDKPR